MDPFLTYAPFIGLKDKSFSLASRPWAAPSPEGPDGAMRAAMAATPPPEAKRDPQGGMSAFDPEKPAEPAPEASNPLSEFDPEPEGTGTEAGKPGAATMTTELRTTDCAAGPAAPRRSTACP